jgi:hypothetical protein
LTIVTHPEAALHIAASALVFFFFFGRSKRGVIKSIIVAGLTILVTAPWWGTVLAHHGIRPFLSASETGFFSIEDYIRLLQFDITDEIGLPTIGALGLIGLFLSIARRKYFLPVWVIVILISEPRSAPLYLCPSVVLLASYSLCTILQIFNKTTQQEEVAISYPHPLTSKVSKGFFSLLYCQWFFSSVGIIIILLSQITITNADNIAFDWIKFNTPADSRFLVLTGFSPFIDPISEWFPALTDRVSIATVQGHEWDNHVSFEKIERESIKVQICIYQTIDCIESWAEENHKVFDYVYIHIHVSQPDVQSGLSFTSALGDLSLTEDYTDLVYTNGDVSIYKVK